MDDRTRDNKRPRIVCCSTTKVVELKILTVAEEQEDIEQKLESTAAVKEGGHESVDVESRNHPGPVEDKGSGGGDGEDAWKSNGSCCAKEEASNGWDLAYFVHLALRSQSLG